MIDEDDDRTDDVDEQSGSGEAATAPDAKKPGPSTGVAKGTAATDGDLILKTQVAEMRRAGYTFKTIARKVGVPEQKLGEWVREWVRDALDLHPDSGQYIFDLSLSRYEELYRKIFAAVAETDKKAMQGQGFARLARLAMDIIKAECQLVGRGAGGGGFDDGDGPMAPDDVEGEARRLGVPLAN